MNRNTRPLTESGLVQGTDSVSESAPNGIDGRSGETFLNRDSPASYLNFKARIQPIEFGKRWVFELPWELVSALGISEDKDLEASLTANGAILLTLTGNPRNVSS